MLNKVGISYISPWHIYKSCGLYLFYYICLVFRSLLYQMDLVGNVILICLLVVFEVIFLHDLKENIILNLRIPSLL